MRRLSILATEGNAAIFVHVCAMYVQSAVNANYWLNKLSVVANLKVNLLIAAALFILRLIEFPVKECSGKRFFAFRVFDELKEKK